MSTAARLSELRSGGPADLPAVSAVMEQAFDPQFGEAWTSGQCMGMLSLPGVWLTLAIDDAMLAGFALARTIADEGELLLLAVCPAVRGRGIGAELLRSVVAACQSRDARRLHLEVRAGNPAISLYRAHGFEHVGTRRNYYRGVTGQSFDAQTFARAIG